MKNQAQIERKHNRSKEQLQRGDGKIRLRVAVNREFEKIIARGAKKLGVSRPRFIEAAVRERLPMLEQLAESRSENNSGAHRRVAQDVLEDAIDGVAALLETVTALFEQLISETNELILSVDTICGLRKLAERERVHLHDSFERFIVPQNAAR